MSTGVLNGRVSDDVPVIAVDDAAVCAAEDLGETAVKIAERAMKRNLALMTLLLLRRRTAGHVPRRMRQRSLLREQHGQHIEQ